MSRGAKKFVFGLFSFLIIGSLLIGGCTRYANEEQITVLEESEQAAVASEDKVAELEKEKAELQAKLAEKQDELKQVQEEKVKIEGMAGE